jgi:hypothetical protein
VKTGILRKIVSGARPAPTGRLSASVNSLVTVEETFGVIVGSSPKSAANVVAIRIENVQK